MLATAEIVFGVTAAHVLAGGSLPDPWTIAALTLLVFGLSAAFLRGRIGYLPAVAVGSLAQVAVHIGYAALPASAEPHAAHGAHAGPAVDTAVGTTAVDLGAAVPSGSMILAHAVSALVVAAVWSLRARALEAAVGWLRAGPAAPVGAVPVLRRTPTRPHARFVELCAAPRGPPVALARP
ncbi:hypothetical protein [Nocardioides speluncae]|uniref:hypothetical protein n=1 Tax=Nocardioides speluncae TaxID=2670337 RepID=UPI000D6860D7|nr:hypothetical protein [Nocardioides speluncae]